MSSPALAGHLVRCKQCGTSGVALEGQNVHDALDCPCCPSSTHTHASGGAEQMSTADPCRSVDVFANALVIPSLGGDA